MFRSSSCCSPLNSIIFKLRKLFFHGDLGLGDEQKGWGTDWRAACQGRDKSNINFYHHISIEMSSLNEIDIENWIYYFLDDMVIIKILMQMTTK